MAGMFNMDDYEAAARELLDPGVYGYYAGGSDDEITLHENREAFQRLKVRYRVLVDVSERDTSTTLLGVPLSSPIILAPTALHRMAHPDGERATARAAARAGTLLALSSISSVTLEEVAEAAPEGARWFQLYHYNDRARTEWLIRRAVDAGYRAIVLTVDAPVIGRRERDLRIPFVMPDDVTGVHFGAPPRTADDTSPIAAFIDQPSINWDDLAWIRETAGDVPLLVKGVVRGDDAKRALDEGCGGIWVSNHGGRQLDTSIPTAAALPEVVEAVGERAPVIVDGGVRRGTDALKAIALGATAVAVGRPQLWGLAVDGEDGVFTVLEMLRQEFSIAMALAGCPTVADIGPDLLTTLPPASATSR